LEALLDMQSRVIFGKDEPQAQAFIVASVGEADGDGLVWHPLVFRGGWTHPQSGAFHIGTKDTSQMLQNFEAGIPSQGGIPIDEDGMHNQRAEGAWGWIEKLEKRDGSVWGGIRWTPEGQDVVASGRFRFISARFTTSRAPADATFGDVGAFIRAAALVTRPFFHAQPQVEIAASLFTVDPDAVDPDEADGDPGESTVQPGGSPMADAKLETGARERYEEKHGKQEDKQWAELTKGVKSDEQWAAFIEEHVPDEGDETAAELAKMRDEVGALRKELEDAKAAAEAAAEAGAASGEGTGPGDAREAIAASAAQAKELETARGEITALSQQVSELRAHRTTAEIREEIAASTFGGNPPTPAAIEVITAVRANPSADTVAALLTHLDENEGHVGTYIAGEVAATTGHPEGSSPEQILEGLAYTPAAKKWMREAMGRDSNLTLDRAEELYLDHINAGV
jgi:hypothetical protein